MIQGKVKKIQKRDSYRNKKGIDIHIFDIAIENNKRVYQWHSTDIKHERFQVGEVVSFETEFVEGSNYKYYKIKPENYKPNYNYKPNKNGLQFKKVDISMKCMELALSMLKSEIDSTAIQDGNDDVFDRVGSIASRLYQDVFSIAKL